MNKTLTLLLLVILFTLGYGASQAQTRTVTGTVYGSKQDPLIGAQIHIEGTDKATTSDYDGKYRIEAGNNDVLIFSYLGYDEQKRTVGTSSTIDITLGESAETLDDVVVIGYGSVKKQDLTGSVSVIGNKEIKNYPASNFQDLLVGRAAGVEATASSGKPGDAAQVRIRGIGTVNTTAPLYVVDGVPLNSTVDLDPRSIESMQILKDASATAIYGSRGSNGVVLITTKNGSSGKISIAFDSYLSLNKMNIKYPQASSKQLYDFYLETNTNDGTSPDPLVANQYNKGYNTDWVKLCTQLGFNQNYGLSVSGGTERFKSSLNIGYTNEDGTMKKNTLEKITLRNRNEYSPSKWLKIGNTLGVGYYKIGSSLTSLDILLTADPFTPVINPLADPSLSNYYYDKYAPTEFSFNTNPMSLLSQSNGYETEFNPFGSIYADINIYDGLYFKSQAAFEKCNYESQIFEPYYHLVPSADDVAYNSQKYRDINKFSLARSQTLYLNLEQTLRYEKEIGKNSINAVVGMTWESWSDTGMSASRTGMPSNDEIFWTLDSGTGGDLAASSKGEQRMISYLGRVNYSYDGRYMATVSFRADGSSEFSKGNRWGYFPSFSVGWDISREPFFKRAVKNSLVSKLKIRAGWGQTGNKSAASRRQISSLMGTSRGVNYLFGGDRTADPSVGYIPITRGNKDLKWETGEQYNIGVDLAMFNGAFNVSVDLYSKYTNDMILTIDLPDYAQFPSSPKANMGSMRNNGIDVNIGYNGTAGDFGYGIDLNLSAYKSTVRSLGGNPEYWSGSVSRSIVGEEFGQFYTLEYLGIFQTQKEIDMYLDKNGRMIQPLAKPGDFKFADANGDGQITDADRGFHGKPQPSMTFGFNFNATYKNFDLTLFFNGSVGNEIFNSPKAFYGKLQKNNITQDLYENSWRKKGDNTKYPRVSAVDLNNNYRYSTWYIEDGSYIKLRNVQLGYTIPTQAIQKTKIIKGFRVYISAQNLFTITKYTGLDPEVGFNGIEDPRRYVLPRMYILGINMNF